MSAGIIWSLSCRLRQVARCCCCHWFCLYLFFGVHIPVVIFHNLCMVSLSSPDKPPTYFSLVVHYFCYTTSGNQQTKLNSVKLVSSVEIEGRLGELSFERNVGTLLSTWTDALTDCEKDHLTPIPTNLQGGFAFSLLLLLLSPLTDCLASHKIS